MSLTNFSSFSPSLGHVLLFFLFVTGTLGRRYLIQTRNVRNGGFPKFPIDDFTAAISCGLKVSPKIVGGSSTVYGDHPWQVEIEVYKRRKGFGHHCGGAIIGPLHVLTAAHCLEGYNKNDFQVKAGDHNLERKDEDEQIFEVESWRVHPNFRKGGHYTNDMAVVKLQARRGKGIQMSRFVSPVCLPSASTPYTPGTKCQVSGWGLTDPNNDFSHSNVLQSAEVPLMSNSACKDFHGNDFGPGMVCAGYSAGKIDSCNGDSGGPLACEINGLHTLLGVVSWGIDCAKPKLPGVYSSTQYYRDWILTAVEEL